MITSLFKQRKMFTSFPSLSPVEHMSTPVFIMDGYNKKQLDEHIDNLQKIPVEKEIQTIKAEIKLIKISLLEIRKELRIIKEYLSILMDFLTEHVVLTIILYPNYTKTETYQIKPITIDNKNNTVIQD